MIEQRKNHKLDEWHDMVVDRWIPCSKELPPGYTDVLVFTDGHYSTVWSLTKDFFDEDVYLWEDENGEIYEFEEALAWMPLPEPYKGE